MNTNPLASSQREKSGSITFGKYEYQYHLALCRIIDEQKNAREYALFMEFHEDVVISDSLDSNIAQFEFYQVKNITSPKYTTANLTKVKKIGNSVLAKLITSALNKPFSKKVSTINLVASCGFSFELLNNDFNLDVITVGDLSYKSIEQLKLSLKEEIGIESLPDNLRFIVPSLSISDQQYSVIGKISTLVSTLFPNSHCNAENIYRILIDELHRKGSVYYDYQKWDDLLENKALTSKKVTQVISTHVSLQDIKSILDEASEIASELNLDYVQKKRLKKNIERIHLNAIGFPTALNLKISASIYRILSSIAKDISDLNSLIHETLNLIPDKTKHEIGNSDDIRDSIIYEIITRDIWV